MFRSLSMIMIMAILGIVIAVLVQSHRTTDSQDDTRRMIADLRQSLQTQPGGGMGVTLLANVSTPSPGSSACTITSGVVMGTNDNNNVSIAYLTAGDPMYPTVMLIHGNGATADSWKSVMCLLSPSYYVVAPYRRGTLPSDQPNTGSPLYDYSWAATATDFMLVLQYLSVGLPHLVGHSYAGSLVEQYYFQYKNDPVYQPSSLTLMAVNFFKRIPGSGSGLIGQYVTAGDERGVATAFASTAVTIEYPGQVLSATDTQQLVQIRQDIYTGALQTSIYAYQAFKAVSSLASSNFVPTGTSLPSVKYNNPQTFDNPIGTFSNITLRTLVIGGNQDVINGPTSTFQSPGLNWAILAALLPNSLIREWVGLPHFAMLTHSRRLAQEFRQFFTDEHEPLTLNV